MQETKIFFKKSSSSLTKYTDTGGGNVHAMCLYVRNKTSTFHSHSIALLNPLYMPVTCDSG